MSAQKDIEQFYTGAERLLQKLWSGRMIHFGYYPEERESSFSHEDSLIETVRRTAASLELAAGQLVLDAGCGIGGPGVWVAQNHKVRVHGITNVQLHADRASELARSEGLGRDVVSFERGDYLDTNLSSDSFDAVMAIESTCYAPDKRLFLREMYRLLKPGGRMAVLDAFRTGRGYSPADEELMTSWLTGWGATDIDTIDEFTEEAMSCGFVDVHFENMQKNFRPSHYRGYSSARYLTPLLGFGHRLGKLSAVTYGYCRAARDAYLAAERDLCVQGLFSARKPG